MIVTCPACSSKYKIKDDKIPAKGARISCPSCSHKFVVYRESEGPAPASVQVPVRSMRQSLPEDEDDSDVPTTVMPHGSQLAKEIRRAADRARAEEAAEQAPPTPPPARPVADASKDGAQKLRAAGKAAKAEGGGPPVWVIGAVVVVILVATLVALGVIPVPGT